MFPFNSTLNHFKRTVLSVKFKILFNYLRSDLCLLRSLVSLSAQRKSQFKSVPSVLRCTQKLRNTYYLVNYAVFLFGCHGINLVKLALISSFFFFFCFCLIIILFVYTFSFLFAISVY